MLTKFRKSIGLNGQEILGKRFELVERKAKKAAEDAVRKLEDERDNIDMKLCDLEDLSPKSNDSLIVADGNFDAEDWISQINGLRMKKENNKIKLDIAKATLSEYFDEIKE